jgi:hypothetical protein
MRWNIAGRALALAAVSSVALAGTATAAAARERAAAAANVAITVTAGGDRTGATSVAGLAGERFDFFAGTAGSRPSGGGTPAASCVTGSSGTCTVNVPPRSGGSGSSAAGYWVRQTSVPAGWFASPVLDVGKGGSEVATDYAWLFVPRVTGNLTIPVADTSNGSTPTARGSLWAASRDNPPLPDKCGLNVALDFDLSGSIGSNITQLRSAGRDFVRALTGTPSSVAIYTFATHAPASKPGNSNLPLTSVATDASASTVLNKISGLTVESGKEAGTNWDQGIGQVAASSDKYDVALVLTDGNPTFYGPQASGPGSSTRFIEVENGIFSANAVKAKHTTVISVGVGSGVSRAVSNLSAISGQVAGQDYFTTGFDELSRLLTALAEKSCLGTVNVVKEVIPSDHQGDFGAAEPAPGWTFRAQPASVTPQQGVTGPNGAVSFAVSNDEKVTLTEDEQAGFEHVKAPSGKNAICRTPGGLEVEVTDARPPGFTVEARKNLIITCLVYNQAVAKPKPATVIVNKTWDIDGTSYHYPDQPQDFQASLALDPVHPAGTTPDWGTEYSGYYENDQVTIGETGVRIPSGCTLETRGDGQETLNPGRNIFTIDNVVSCTTQLTLVKEIDNPFPGVPVVPITSWTLTATAPDGTVAVQGTSGETGAVEPGLRYVLAESDVPGYQQTVVPGAVLAPGATGSWHCVQQVVTAGRVRSGLEDYSGADGTITVPIGTTVVCTAVNLPRAATLTLVKHVAAGDAAATDWTLTAAPVSGPGPVVSGQTGTDEVTDQLIPPGETYRLSESGGPAGYQLQSLACAHGDEPVTLTGDEFTAGIDEHITCTFVNKEVSGPTPPPTPTPTPTKPCPTPTPTHPVPPGPPMPVTGANLLLMLGIGSTLTAAGAGTLAVARVRRRRGTG